MCISPHFDIFIELLVDKKINTILVTNCKQYFSTLKDSEIIKEYHFNCRYCTRELEEWVSICLGVSLLYRGWIMIHVFFFIYFISSFLTCTYMHKCIRMPTHTLHMDVHMHTHRNMQAYTFCVLDLLVIIHAHLYNTRSSHKCHSQSANQIPLKLY